VGDSGTILTSSNAVDWLAGNSGVTDRLGDIVFGNGLFVAVGNGGKILTSSDGSVWTARNSTTTKALQGIAYGRGRFVAVVDWLSTGTGGYVVTSTNGVDWVSAPGSIVSLAPTSIAYGNGLFAMLADVSSTRLQFLVSENGTTWIQRNWVTNLGFGVNGLGFNNGTFVGVGSAGRILQSDPVVRMGITSGESTQLTVEGPRNRMYRIESAGLPGGTNVWQERTNLLMPPFTWVDPDSQLSSNRAYRAFLVP
jgi:hypothetical protein